MLPSSSSSAIFHRADQSNRQGGFSLIVTLLMLLVIAILGISATNMALNEERGSRNNRDKQIAFQAAEAALADAELEMDTTNVDPAHNVDCDPNHTGIPYRGRKSFPDTCFDGISHGTAGFNPGNCSALPNVGLCESNAWPATPEWLNVDFLADAQGRAAITTVEFGQFTGRTYASVGSGGAPAFAPRYIIELVPRNTLPAGVAKVEAGDGQQSSPKLMYRITAMGFGPRAETQVVLQALYSPNTSN